MFTNLLSYFYPTKLETSELSIIPDQIKSTKYGWKRDLPDIRDIYHDFITYTITSNGDTKTLPNKVDLRESDVGLPPVYDQGSLGSCSANAIAGAYEYDQMYQREESPFCPSRLFVYYNERALEGSTDRDSGASLRDGIKTISSIGVVPESEWPYDISKFTVKPDSSCYINAKKHTAIEYKKVYQSLDQLKSALHNEFPIIFGFMVYDSFETKEVAETGIMVMPTPNDKPLGGHAVLAVGYDDDKEVFIVRNSWSDTWGDKGYFYMPYEYMLSPDLSSDFWTVTKVVDQFN